MSILQNFLNNDQDINGIFFKDFLKSNDIDFQLNEDIFISIFPQKMKKQELESIKKDEKIKKAYIEYTKKFLDLLGFIFIDDSNELLQIKKMEREENGVKLGFNNEKNYRKITLIMLFLDLLKIYKYKYILMLACCYAMKINDIKYKILMSGEYDNWINFNPFIKQYYKCSIKGLENFSNSCYIDSVLLALFSKDNKFIQENILDKDIEDKNLNICDKNKLSLIQKELIKINNSIKNRGEEIDNCRQLRNLLKYCGERGKQFNTSKMQDSGEFLQFLFSLFKVENTITLHETLISNFSEKEEFKKIKSDIDNTANPVIPIFASFIEEGKKLSKYLFQMEDSFLDEKNLYNYQGKTYNRRVEKRTIIDSNYLVFYPQRLIDKKNRNYDRIEVEEYIKLKNNVLELSAIVVHESSHYTVYFKCGNIWYYHNDIPNKIYRLGYFEDMKNIKDKPNILTNGILYFYT